MSYALAAEQNKPELIEQHIRNAKTYYWLGLAEQGNVECFRNARKLISKAEEILNDKDDSIYENLSDLDRYRKIIVGLKKDVLYQQDMAHDTFYGVFPLCRFFKSSLFLDAEAYGTYELVDDYDVIAVTRCAEALSEQLKTTWQPKPSQFDVMFLSYPANDALENEALYIFNTKSDYFVSNLADVSTSLTQESLDMIRERPINKTDREVLANELGSNSLLFISINKRDAVDDVIFYEASASYVKDGLHVMGPSRVFGLCRDRTKLFIPILLLHAFLFLSSCIIYYLLIDRTTRRYSYIFPSILAFLIGRFSPWFILGLISSITPSAENLAILSLWWVMLLGFTLLAGPFAIYRILAGRIKPLLQNSDALMNWRAAGVSLSLGIIAFLVIPVFLYLQEYAILFLIVSAIVVISVNLTIAQQFSVTFSAKALCVVSLLSFGFGLALCAANLMAMLILCALSALSSYWLIMRVGITNCAHEHPDIDINIKNPIDNITREILIERTFSPLFYKTEAYNELHSIAVNSIEGVASWTYMYGLMGSGKSATVHAVIDSLKQNYSKDKIVFMEGVCDIGKPGDSKTPYDVFSKALVRYFKINIFSPSDAQLQKVNEALDGIFDILPFAGLIAPSEDGKVCHISKEEIHQSVIRTLKIVASKSKLVVLHLDDIQWIDEESIDLLNTIFKNVEPGADQSILLLLSSRDDQSKFASAPGVQKIEVKRLDLDEKAQLLQYALSYKPQKTSKIITINIESARRIVSDIDLGHDYEGELLWLFTIVRHLLIHDVLVIKHDEFCLQTEYTQNPQKALPLPDEFKDEIKERLAEHESFRSILECAACLGREFRASIVADSLEIKRLRTIQLLDRIEKLTGFIRDVREEDDVYTFSSSSIVEVLREEIQYAEQGPSETTVPQVIREYHARAAEALEKTLQSNNAMLLEVANHYYAAGVSYSDNACKYTLKAFHAMLTSLCFDKAESYLSMHKECCGFSHTWNYILDLDLALRLEQTHVIGSSADKISLASLVQPELQYHDTQKPDLYVKKIRCIYDAIDPAGGCHSDKGSAFVGKAIKMSISLIEWSKTLSKNYTNNSKYSPMYYHCEGLHFLGQSRRDNAVLKEAYDKLHSLNTPHITETELLGRVCNSLAGGLTYSKDIKEKELALAYYNESLSIKQMTQITDHMGIAMSHGGLGRTYFELALAGVSNDLLTHATERDRLEYLNNAMEHFTKNLEISMEIGNMTGQLQMLSYLGSVHLFKHEYAKELCITTPSDALEQAFQFYSDSLSIAESSDSFIGIAHARIGLLRHSWMKRDHESNRTLSEEIGKMNLRGELLHEYQRYKL